MASMAAFALLISLTVIGFSNAQLPLLSSLSTFAGGTYHDFDGHVYAANETVVFSHQVSTSASAGMMTFADFTAGKNAWGRFLGDHTIIRYYIDGEASPSLEFVPGAAAGSFVHLEGLDYYSTQYDPKEGGPGRQRCDWLHPGSATYEMGPYCGMDLVDSDSNDGTFQPWMTKWSGKLGPEGSWTLSFRIPFSKHIRITAQIDPKILPQFTVRNGWNGGPLTVANASSYLFAIFRGVEGDEASLGQLVQLGGAAMPPIKSWGVRLRLLKLESFIAKPLAFVPLANISVGDPEVTGGALFMSTVNWRRAGVASSTQVKGGSIEGCWWALTSPESELKPGMAMPLGAGAEDFFGDSYGFGYWSKVYHTQVSGLSHVHGGTGAGAKRSSADFFSAYRYFDQDPLTFKERFFMTWRNGAVFKFDSAGKATKCFLDDTGGQGNRPPEQIIDSYTWVYTWRDPSRINDKFAV